jgi:large subunit ribosomal protein L19
MYSLIESINSKDLKKKVTDVRSGDTVRVHQKIKEGEKSRVQVFEGLVIATKSPKSVSASMTVRRMASGVGVEKTFMLHSPLIEKIDVVKRTKVRRNKLNYMKARSGKSARLRAVAFDMEAVNKQQLIPVEEQRDKVIEAKADDQPKDEKADETTKAATAEAEAAANAAEKPKSKPESDETEAEPETPKQ